MLEFDEEEAKNMSQNKVLSIVCEGLAEICENRAKKQPEIIGGKKKIVIKERCPVCRKYRTVIKTQKSHKKEFEKRAKVFRNYSKLFLNLDEVDKNGREKN
jgi:hypothetical protein